MENYSSIRSAQMEPPSGVEPDSIDRQTNNSTEGPEYGLLHHHDALQEISARRQEREHNEAIYHAGRAYEEAKDQYHHLMAQHDHPDTRSLLQKDRLQNEQDVQLASIRGHIDTIDRLLHELYEAGSDTDSTPRVRDHINSLLETQQAHIGDAVNLERSPALITAAEMETLRHILNDLEKAENDLALAEANLKALDPHHPSLPGSSW